MTTTTPAAPPRAETLSPTIGATVRRWRFWVITLALVVVAVILYNLFSSGGRDMTPFGADNAGPAGGRALVEVLRSQGVDVLVATTIEEAADSGRDPDLSTLVVHDPNLLLDADRLDRLDGIAANVVLVAPDTATLDALAPEVALGGTPDAEGSLAPGCEVPVAVRAGSMTASAGALRPSGAAGSADASFCFVDDADLAQIAFVQRDDVAVTVLAGTAPFENEGITTAGNAALGLGILGSSPSLTWYEPGLDDIVGGVAPPTSAQLTPEWVTPVLVMLLLVALAAAVWRGRRMGPLVVENLPVVVRAGETIEGRARMYRRSSARLHSLDSLRMGSVGRLAADLGLPRSADVDEVCRATALRLRRPEAQIRALLLENVPGTDEELLEGARALQELESDVTATLGER